MSKTSNAKDAQGIFHPGKGKPSGINKQEGLGFQPTAPEKMEQYLQMTDKYTLDADKLDPSVRMRHPNRNVSKGGDSHTAKENKPDVDDTVKTGFKEDRSSVTSGELTAPITKDQLHDLANYSAPCCISLFLQSHASGVGINEQDDAINFQKQLKEINRRLVEKGYDDGFIDQLLQPCFDLIRNVEFWKELPGLGIFIAPGYFRYIKMPATFLESLTLIDVGFYILPLVSLSDDGD